MTSVDLKKKASKDFRSLEKNQKGELCLIRKRYIPVKKKKAKELNRHSPYGQ